MEITEFCNQHPEISSLDKQTIERMYSGQIKSEQEWFDLLSKDFVSVVTTETKTTNKKK